MEESKRDANATVRTETDRNSVEEGLNHIQQIIQRRQRGPDRDYGASRSFCGGVVSV